MLRQKLLDLLLQPVLERVGHDRKVQRRRGIFRQVKESRLDAPIGIFQTEVQNFPLCHGEIPERLPLRNAQAQPQCQPRFSDLRCASEDVQTLREQFLYQKRRWFIRPILQIFCVDGFQFGLFFTSFRFCLL